MPSPPKHSYTKSVTTPESYAGNRGKTALIHAIELLFFVKSAEFRKYHPSFITPSADEFLDYVQSRYRKYVVLPTMRHRPLHISPTPKPPVLFKQFLGFIHAPAVAASFQSLIGCLFVVVESLSLYGTVKSVLAATPSGGSEWRSAYCSTAFMDEFTAPVYWLLEHKMSSCFSYRAEILTKITQPLIKKSAAILETIPAATPTASTSIMLEALGQQYVHAFQKVMTDEVYKLQFVAPLSFLFGTRGGVLACKDFCETFIKKYTDLVLV